MSVNTKADKFDDPSLSHIAARVSLHPSQRPSSVHIPPIRSLTVREPVRFPSRRSLQWSDGDGQDDPPIARDITKAISRLESLVQQITELAEQPQPQPVTRRRSSSEDVTAKGFQRLASTKGSTVSLNPVQPNNPARGELLGTKGPPAKPQITITTADEKTPEHNVKPGSAEKKLRRQVQHNTREPSHPPPPPPAQIHHSRPPRRGHRKPDRREVSPFEDEEKVFGSLDPRPGHERHFTQMFGIRHNSSTFKYDRSQTSESHVVDLRRVNHVDLLNKPEAFEVHTSCDHAPIARHWPDSKKRFTASLVCLNTASIGMIIGMYSGEVPAIQYVIADFHHYAILGNVFLYCGLAISTFLLWPLPLLHGRKVYTIAGLVLALGLQIPQGISLIQYRMPEQVTWRTLLLVSRALSGLVLGLVNINLFPTLLDLFGASLQSSHPYGEESDPYDVRRHGGGMGLWLAAWS